MSKKIYVAGRIQGAHPATLVWHERLGLALRDKGFDTFVPHQDEPANDTGGECFKRDLKEMATSDLLVATLFEPSTGTGIELALFQGPVVIVHRPGELSPMVQGLAQARGYVLLPTVNDLDKVVNLIGWMMSVQKVSSAEELPCTQ